jgi:HK97 family phage major capsid protein
MAAATELMEAIALVGKSFETFKEVNDKRIEEERKGNEARAKELASQLEKISAELTDNSKKKTELEKRIAMQAERLELLEALNDRPKATVQDKIRSEHKSNLISWIRSGGSDIGAVNAQKELEAKAREVKDVSIGTTTAGGFALPEEIARTVDKLVPKVSPITQYVKNVVAGTSDYKELLTYYANGTASNIYGWAGETSSRTKTDTPELRERTPTWGGLYAYPRASNWSLQDLFFNVEEWLVDSITEGFAIGQSVAIFNGNGSNKPTGMTNTAPVSTADYASPLRAASAYQYIPIPVAASSPFTTAGITADTVIKLAYSLNQRYRGNARWAANTLTQGHLRSLKASDGHYLWQPGLQAGQPDRLLGYELFTWEELGNPTSANALPIAFGDFAKAYTLVKRPEMQMVRDQVTAPGFTNFYVERRVGGIPTNNDALKFAKVALS